MPRIKVKGKAELSDGWSDVPEGGDASFRFFTVGVALSQGGGRMLPISNVASINFQSQCACVEATAENWQLVPLVMATLSHWQHLQRFQRFGIKKKRHNPHKSDAVLIGPRLFIWVSGHDYFSEVVSDVSKRKSLLLALLVIGDVPC